MDRQKILYIQYTNPAAYPSLEHSSRILARQGWQVLFLGTEDWVGSPMRFPHHTNIQVRKLGFCPGGWRQKFHYLWFCLWVIGWVIRWRPQWIYASDSLSCPLGWLLSHIPGLKVIYHEHDSPGSSNGSRSPSLRFILWARRRLSRRTQFCILPNERRAAYFSSEVRNGHRVFSIWNCPAQEEIAPPRTTRDGENLRILYHGSIVPSRLPASVLEALTNLSEKVKLRVIGYETMGHRGYKERLQEMATRLGIGGRVEFLDPVPTRHELFSLCEKCDVGVALMPRESSDFNERTMASASNKAFDYLACGLALLVSDLPDWREAYVEPGYGLACDPENPESIAKALMWFLYHLGETNIMGERGKQRILTDWNYEQQFAPVLERLNGVKDGKF